MLKILRFPVKKKIQWTARDLRTPGSDHNNRRLTINIYAPLALITQQKTVTINIYAPLALITQQKTVTINIYAPLALITQQKTVTI
jgi:hypothetical protein